MRHCIVGRLWKGEQDANSRSNAGLASWTRANNPLAYPGRDTAKTSAAAYWIAGQMVAIQRLEAYCSQAQGVYNGRGLPGKWYSTAMQSHRWSYNLQFSTSLGIWSGDPGREAVWSDGLDDDNCLTQDPRRFFQRSLRRTINVDEGLAGVVTAVFGICLWNKTAAYLCTCMYLSQPFSISSFSISPPLSWCIPLLFCSLICLTHLDVEMQKYRV